MFRSRQDWYNHENQQHRLEYSCNDKNHEQYSDIREFKSHMIRDHDIQIDDDQTSSMFSRPTQRKSGVCPLCMESAKHLKGHLARHLERIALYALPTQPDTEVDLSDDILTESSEPFPSSEDPSVKLISSAEHEDLKGTSFENPYLAQAGSSNAAKIGSCSDHRHFYNTNPNQRIANLYIETISLRKMMKMKKIYHLPTKKCLLR